MRISQTITDKNIKVETDDTETNIPVSQTCCDSPRTAKVENANLDDFYTKNQLDAGSLDDRYYTQSEINSILIDSGNIDARYVHTQSIASSQWIVNHNLGVQPNIAVLSAGGIEMWAQVIRISENQVIIQLDSPMTGQVVCS